MCAHLLGQEKFSAYQGKPETVAQNYADLLDVKGQAHAKRALEIAAAGGHSLLLLWTIIFVLSFFRGVAIRVA